MYSGEKFSGRPVKKNIKRFDSHIPGPGNEVKNSERTGKTAGGVFSRILAVRAKQKAV